MNPWLMIALAWGACLVAFVALLWWELRRGPRAMTSYISMREFLDGLEAQKRAQDRAAVDALVGAATYEEDA